jgi:ubiquinone/menaquinone biosynthesis C-methylase UbiE
LPLALGKVAGVGVQTAFGLINKRPPFSRRSLDFYIKDNAYDISKARRELGFDPKVSLLDGLMQTMAALDGQIFNSQESSKMDNTLQATVSAVHDYWNSHTLGLQYITDKSLEVGSPDFFAHIRPWMNPYKFPWIMERIERESALLKGKHLLEIGCGMGYDSLEFLKRGVRVTATDLTPNAVEITRRHFELEGIEAEEIRTANALKLPFADNTFDAVWSNGVLHATGDTARAIQEARRVLKPGGRAIISHFYRKPSWMYLMHHVGRENIEYKEEDPPVNEFYTEAEILDFFKGYEVVEAVQEHHRALPVRRDGVKAALYKYGFMPVYNMLPEGIAKRMAYKLSVTAVKK